MSIDFSPFRKALASLEKALLRAQKESGDEELRDACLQRFEYCYELGYKMLIRYLESASANPSEIDANSFKDNVRIGAEKGLIRSPEDWFTFRHARNQTSHAYDGEQAEKVFQKIPGFLTEAQDLLSKLEKASEKP